MRRKIVAQGTCQRGRLGPDIKNDLISQYSRGKIGKIKNWQFDDSIHYSYLFSMTTGNRMKKKISRNNTPVWRILLNKHAHFKSESASWVTSAFRHVERDKSRRACKHCATMFKYTQLVFKVRSIFFLNGIFLRNERSICSFFSSRNMI